MHPFFEAIRKTFYPQFDSIINDEFWNTLTQDYEENADIYLSENDYSIFPREFCKQHSLEVIFTWLDTNNLSKFAQKISQSIQERNEDRFWEIIITILEPLLFFP